MNSKLLPIYKLSIVAIGVLFCANTMAQNNELNEIRSQQFLKIYEAVENNSEVVALVQINVPNIQQLISESAAARSHEEGQVADNKLANAINITANTELSKLDKNNYQIIRQFQTIPYVSLRINKSSLEKLDSLPNVVGITLESFLTSSLSNSTVTIGADHAWAEGFDGSGQTVAVLDLGLNGNHEMFVGKTVTEACFARGNDNLPGAGDCPNGQDTDTTTLHAAAEATGLAYTDKHHGTQATGIIAGDGPALQGVAHGADIMAIRVASEVFSPFPTLLAWNSDVIAGLEHVYLTRFSHNFAAVNMSLEGLLYLTESQCDQDQAPIKAVIDNLRSVGIPSIVSAGNNFSCTAIATPACISTAIAVGSTDINDNEAVDSDYQPDMIDFFAPGVSISSASGPGNSDYDTVSGTSFAAPHVTGAWAIIKQLNPNASIDDVYNILLSTGDYTVGGKCASYPNPIQPRINLSMVKDCNSNNVLDVQDVDPTDPDGDGFSSSDCNSNMIPDECELINKDCNGNLIPDDCELSGNDCNSNMTPDECELQNDCCVESGSPGCDDIIIETCVCNLDSFCCTTRWDDICVSNVEILGCGVCVNNNDNDCNGNMIPDDCEITTGNDCDGDSLLDECETDCNGNMIPDDCELTGNDCNSNMIPDDCELTGNDCDGNMIPDDCELSGNDCNRNMIPDDCELIGNDCNSNMIPDDCDLQTEVTYASNTDVQVPDNSPAGINIPFTVDQPININDTRITLDIDHTWFGDLCVSLTAPGGAPTVQLIASPGTGSSTDCNDRPSFGCNSNNPIIELSDSGTDGLIEDACGFFSNDLVPAGTYIPAETLSTFNGIQAQGTWTFNVSDNAQDDTGFVNAWSITFINRTENDCNGNMIPDDCELTGNDCNGNMIPDDCEISSGNDCNGNNVLDECDLLFNSEESSIIYSPTTNQDDRFGYNVAIYDDIMVVSADEDECGFECGSVYVYRYDGTSWVMEQKLTASDGESLDRFGSSISISNDLIVVGAPNNPFTPDELCGAVYVFRFNGISWVEEQKLTASVPCTYRIFGKSVSVADNVIAVGSGTDPFPVGMKESVYIFRYNGAQWQETQNLSSPDQNDFDNYGSSLSMSGNVLVIGAPAEPCIDGSGATNCGAVYVYRDNGVTWQLEQMLTSSAPSLLNLFGSSVSISDDVIVAGSDCFNDSVELEECSSAYVFRFDGITWQEEQVLTASDSQLNDRYGLPVSISGDSILIGALLSNCATEGNCGAAYLYKYNGITWQQVRKLTASNSDLIQGFGNDLAMSDNTLAISSINAGCSPEPCGAVFVFNPESNDCNSNMIPDECELTGNDCNLNLIPDECEPGGVDCDNNLTLDLCELGNIIYVDHTAGTCESGLSTYPYSSVSEGYGAATEGNILRIRSGTYSETIRFDKPIRIENENGSARIESE